MSYFVMFVMVPIILAFAEFRAGDIENTTLRRLALIGTVFTVAPISFLLIAFIFTVTLLQDGIGEAYTAVKEIASQVAYQIERTWSK